MMKIENFDSPIGALVTGVDLSDDLDPDSFETLQDAWNERSVLVYRDQTLSPAELVNFSGRFGEHEIHVLNQYLHPDQPEILVVSNVKKDGEHIGVYDAGRYWHTDLSYLAKPSRGSVLYAIEIPEENGKPLGDTIWASTAAAFEGLNPGLQERLDGRTAMFDFAKRYRKLVADGDQNAALTDEQKAKTPPVEHPVVRTHPVTGRKCLNVNEGHTVNINGMDDDESLSLLEDLWAHIVKPDFTYRHKWRPGDVVMWDNVPTQHLAICDYALPQRRLLHRTTLTGTRPY